MACVFSHRPFCNRVTSTVQESSSDGERAGKGVKRDSVNMDTKYFELLHEAGLLQCSAIFMAALKNLSSLLAHLYVSYYGLKANYFLLHSMLECWIMPLHLNKSTIIRIRMCGSFSVVLFDFHYDIV